MADLVRDSFDRPDGAVGNADSGQTWLFTGTYGLVIDSHRVGSAGGSGYAYIDAGSVPDYVQADVQALTVSGNRTSIVFRGVGANDYWLSLLYYTGSVYQIYTAYYQSGSLKSSQNATVAATTGNWYTLKVIDTGDTVETWFNGVKLFTHASTVHNTGTRVGVWMDNTSLRMDDFLAATSETGVTLTVADAAHTQGADVLALTQAHRLAVAGAMHMHTVETITIPVDARSGTVTAGDAALYMATLADAGAYGLVLTDAGVTRLSLADAAVYAAVSADVAVTALTLEESLG